jgi:hypothetical protein
MVWRREYFKRIEYEGQVHIRAGGLQESITLCGWNDFLSAKDSSKAVTCNLCRSIANYCQDHVRLRPPKKLRKPEPQP